MAYDISMCGAIAIERDSSVNVQLIYVFKKSIKKGYSTNEAFFTTGFYHFDFDKLRVTRQSTPCMVWFSAIQLCLICTTGRETCTRSRQVPLIAVMVE